MHSFVRLRIFSVESFTYLIIFGFIVITSIGGCNSGGNTEPRIMGGVLVGEHRQDAVDTISEKLIFVEQDNTTNHIHIDGTNLENLTVDEKAFVQNSLNDGFIISIYELEENLMPYLFREVLNHPDLHAEGESNVNLGDQVYTAFTVEQIEGVMWTSIGEFYTTSILRSEETDPPVVTIQEQVNSLFDNYADHTRNWIKDQAERQINIAQDNDGLLNQSLTQDGFELTQRDLTTTGSVVSFAKKWVQTNKFTVKLNIAGDASQLIVNDACEGCTSNNYTIETQAWVVTTGSLESYIFAVQELSLGNDGNIVSDNDFNKEWYLRGFENINNIFIKDQGYLDSTEARLVNFQPDGITSINMNFEVDGTVFADQTSGDRGSMDGAMWSASGATDPLGLDIEPKPRSSTAEDGTQYNNDTTWAYVGKEPQLIDKSKRRPRAKLEDLAPGSKDLVDNLSQAFIYKIENYADQTLVLKTQAYVRLASSFVCKGFCSGSRTLFDCEDPIVSSARAPSSKNIVFSQSIHLPAADQ